ncbi:MAG: hypothetical protein O7C75_16695, partial [Verrucomicrobia bacterium]|nr:hypothetical protein [Verrucomicrobiota bacterium]
GIANASRTGWELISQRAHNLRNRVHQSCSHGSVGARSGNWPLYLDLPLELNPTIVARISLMKFPSLSRWLTICIFKSVLHPFDEIRGLAFDPNWG